VVAATEVHLTAPVEELVAAAIAEAEAMRTATSLATHMATTTLAIGSTRSATKRPPKQATATACFPAYSARLRNMLLPEKFIPLGISKYDAEQDPV
jgi:hypothetical protein